MAPGGDAYEALGSLYDVWCESVVEDLDFYLEACAGSDGPIVELGVGSGRVAVPLALAGHRVRGLDASPAMLALARTRAEEAGVSERITSTRPKKKKKKKKKTLAAAQTLSSGLCRQAWLLAQTWFSRPKT